MTTEQLNFRISKDEKRVIDAIAEERGVSAAELARKSLFKEIEPIRVDLAFKLLAEGKIGRKRAWVMSGLSHNEFLIEWTKRGAEEQIPDEFIEKELDIARAIDLKKFMRNQPQG